MDVDAHQVIPSNDRYLFKKPEGLLDQTPLAHVPVSFDFLERQLGCNQIHLCLLVNYEEPGESVRLRWSVVLRDRGDDVIV